MKWALIGFFRLVGRSLRNMKIQTSNAIYSFANSPVENLSILLSSAAFLVSLVAFIVALISFICNGGYRTQLEAIRESGPLDYKLSAGTVSILTGEYLVLSLKYFWLWVFFFCWFIFGENHDCLCESPVLLHCC